MAIDPKLFKAYDIRGLYPDQLNEENIVPIIRAIYTFFRNTLKKEQLSFVLSYDMRLSGPQLYEAAKKTLVELGAQVIDAGMLSTPSFYFTVSHYGYDCGTQITASHNPKNWNGLKFVMNSSDGLIKIGKNNGMPEIQQLANEQLSANTTKPGTLTEPPNILEDEVENAFALLGHPRIKQFKIVADPANAMGAQYIEALCKKIPVELVKMNFDLDGSFPAHQPDPLDFNNLKDLQERVMQEKADLGLAPDGDGDRLYFVDEKGKIVPATVITALIAREFLKHNPGATILFDIRYIFGSMKIVDEFGGKYEITKVGHAFITEQLRKAKGIFAGESSGHFYYKANGYSESQLVTILSVLKVLTEENKTLSQVVEELRRSYESGEINFRVTNAQEILDAIKQKYSDAELVTLDGISLSYPQWRCNIRTSNTEPLLRLNIESYEQRMMEEKKNELVSTIESLTKKE